MRILIFNWKDIKHGQAGGAEYATHKLAQELVKLKHQVTVFSSQPKQLSAFESIYGVSVYRGGNALTVYWQAYKYYKNNYKKFDIVIDQIHGMPFFTPLYVKIPILVYIHEIAGPIWFKEFNWFLGLIGYFFEKIYFLIYRQNYFLTDTKHTDGELEKHGISHNRIFILPLTIDAKPLIKTAKTINPSIIYFGRITPMKQLELLINATKILIKKIPDLKVIIAGKAKEEYLNKLKKLITNSDLNQQILLENNVSEKKKLNLLRQSWIQVHPSIKEGFGITVLEAATQATPTIAFDVPGLNLIIKNGVNGYIVKSDSVANLASYVLSLIKDKSKLTQLQQSSYRWSKTFPIYKTVAKKLVLILERVAKKR